MDNKQLVIRLRKKIFHDWIYHGLGHKDIKCKYGFGKTWFYKYRQRYIKYGEKGLEEPVRKKPILPCAVDLAAKLKVLDYIYDNPTHGPKRITNELSLSICPKSVWNFLKAENLNTRYKRRLWAEFQGKPVLTEKERSYMAAQHRHIESNKPGELISMDTFVVNIKGLGKIFQWTACDTYSSYGWAKLYLRKTADQTLDFLENHILKNAPENKIKRVLTDQGVEFYSARHRKTNWQLEKLCKRYNIKHSVTKRAHPWTNGYAERLNQTIWQEFYLCRLSTAFTSLEDVQKQLDEFMRDYNFKRMHTGYKLSESGYRYPAHAFFDVKEHNKLVSVDI